MEAYISVVLLGIWDREFPDVFCFFGIFIFYFLLFSIIYVIFLLIPIHVGIEWD